MSEKHADPQRIITDGMPTQLPDVDPAETQEWVDSLDAIAKHHGNERARYIMLRLLERSREIGVGVPALRSTDYINTIPPSREPEFPGDEAIERRIRSYIRWNAAVMVTRAQRPGVGVGGHIATYASSASLYEVGFNHFFRGKDHAGGGDQIYIQGHGSPGIYARAFLEGRLSEGELDLFRQESKPGGLSSYPHPRLMPDFWEFPTVSMGIGTLGSIYQARFNRYMHGRGIADTSDQRVWAFVGDGEMDEPEAQGALTLGGREELDNLTWVVNCNLQRLDGPVRSNGKIIQELESLFGGAGWNVIKVVWGSKWDQLLAQDTQGDLVDRMNSTPDGQFQTYTTKDGDYIREHFFNTPELRRILSESGLTEDDLPVLDRGGHDARKVHAAFKAATEHKGQPTVILAKTIKGWTLGPDFEARNATHQMKKLTRKALKLFRDRLHLDISDEQLDGDLPPYYHPGPDSDEIAYMMDRRAELGGPIPQRRVQVQGIELPAHDVYGELKKGSGKNEIATTMAFVRLLKDLIKTKDLGPRIVPIVPDEARTFGMDTMFKSEKIYSPHGMTYEAVDQAMLLSYNEATDGQILNEGITEAGSMASFTAAGSAYATHGQHMLPIYIFYSMFGFQRTGDSIWQAADQRCRGFLIGATAGRTTLNGEGLQHEDGHSPILAMTNPAVESFDPSFAYEVAVITEEGVNRMLGEDAEDVMYYLTVYNEATVQPAMPEGLDEAEILDGIYRYNQFEDERSHRVQILSSGSGMTQALRAQQMLGEDWDVAADIWSVPGWVQLHRDGVDCMTTNRDRPTDEPRVPLITRKLQKSRGGPFIAITDYQKALPGLVEPFIPGSFAILGTDGFGRSDTREALRRIFRIDAESIVVAALYELSRSGDVKPNLAAEAIERYGIDPNLRVWDELHHHRE